MNGKTYKTIGRHKDTNRNRTLTILAASQEAAEQSAIEQGLLTPLQAEEVIDAPTERQLAYALDLGIVIPENATRKDVSCLIDKVTSRDPEPNPGLIEFADGKGILFSPYIGKRSLYDLVFSSLNALDKAAFFTFSVYRWLSDDRHANLDTHPEREVFYRFAETLNDNASFRKSMNRYDGKDLRFFGAITSKHNGTISEYSGGSNGTLAYKMVAEFMKNRFNTTLTRGKTFEADNSNNRVYDLAKDDNTLNLYTPKAIEVSGKRFSWTWFIFWVIIFFPIAIVYWFTRKR